MSKRKYSTAEVKAEMSTWGEMPALVTSDPETQQIVRTRKLALDMYADGYSLREIEKRTGINRTRVVRILERCMTYDENGIPIGYWGLYPGLRTVKVRANKIQSIIDKYEGLEKKMLDFYFSAKPGTAFKRPDKKTAFQYFLTELENAGHNMKTHPLNLSDHGQRTFYNWLDQKEKEKALFKARMRAEARVEDAKTGVEGRLLNPTRPYEIIEIDGHRLDLIYVVEAFDTEGNPVAVPVERPWFLAAIDVATRCIVGYRLVFDSEYSSVDVMQLIEGITAPYKGLPGVRVDAMPSQVFEQAQYALPEIISLDNALAHYAKDVLDKTTDYGYHFAFGPVADPTKRPYIERFFGTFETRWGHKVPSTTGSHSKDLVRIKAEEDAVNYCFTQDKVELLIALAVATYNNTLHKGIGMTPIGKMRQLFSLGLIPSRLAYPLRSQFKLFCKRKATLRGNKNAGKQVYLQINGFIYKNDRIKSVYSWVGARVTVLIDPDDITTVYVYSSNDDYLGRFEAKGAYKASDVGRISMKQGKTVQRYLRENNIKKTHGLDDVEEYIRSLKKHPVKKAQLKDLKRISLYKSVNELPNEIPDSREENAEIGGEGYYTDGDFGATGTEERFEFDDRPEEEILKDLREMFKPLHEGRKD